MENESGGKKKRRVRATTIGRKMGGSGSPLWVLVSPVSSTGPQPTIEREVDGNETQEVVDEEFLELAGCQTPASDSPTSCYSPPLCPVGGNEFGQKERLLKKRKDSGESNGVSS